MNRLVYLPVHFFLHFDQKVSVRNNPEPLFVLRSVLGYNLRSMCCIAKNNECATCMYNKTCAYAYIFETILSQDNDVQKGTNRASHPYAMTQSKKLTEPFFSDYDFTITLFGKAIEYLPYIYAAFVRAGKYGLYKDRIPFQVQDVKVQDTSILIDDQSICTDTSPAVWTCQQNMTKDSTQEILIELHTPLRFKTQGKYTINFTAQDFMLCLHRRMRTLCLLYGEYDESTVYRTEDITCDIVEQNLRWTDATHYSSRQKKAMELGGVCGTIKLTGNFSPFELSLFAFSKVCNAGKNTNFGLGQLDYWERSI